VAGAQGPQGDDGAQGFQGDEGAQGPQGDPGDPGGPQGDTGAQGPQGVAGAQGVQGDDGVQGPQGDDGAQGAQGDDGAQGPQGVAGAQGPQGDDGAQGPQGDDGAQGAQGDTGPSGGDDWVAFTITTVTQDVPVSYTVPLSLPVSPSVGDLVVGEIKLRCIWRQGTQAPVIMRSYDGTYVYFEFLCQYYATCIDDSPVTWSFDATDLFGLVYPPEVSNGTLKSNSVVGEADLQIIGTTTDDTDGLHVFYCEWQQGQQHTFPA